MGSSIAKTASEVVTPITHMTRPYYSLNTRGREGGGRGEGGQRPVRILLAKRLAKETSWLPPSPQQQERRAEVESTLVPAPVLRRKWRIIRPDFFVTPPRLCAPPAVTETRFLLSAGWHSPFPLPLCFPPPSRPPAVSVCRLCDQFVRLSLVRTCLLLALRCCCLFTFFFTLAWYELRGWGGVTNQWLASCYKPVIRGNQWLGGTNQWLSVANQWVRVSTDKGLQTSDYLWQTSD